MPVLGRTVAPGVALPCGLAGVSSPVVGGLTTPPGGVVEPPPGVPPVLEPPVLEPPVDVTVLS
jgi:hypothetical protein